MTDLEKLIKATLDEDGARYPVSVGALGRLHERLAGTTERRPRGLGIVGGPRRLSLAGGVLVGVAAAVAVLLAAVSSGPRRAAPPVSLGNAPAASSAPAPTLPAAFASVKTLGLNFSATRLLLAGDDVYAFGADSAEHPWVARIHDLSVLKQAKLPALVCSASIDGTDVIAVVLQDGPDGDACSLRNGRGSLGLLDPVSLDMLSPSVPARGGDTLVRPEGTYVADAGVLSLLDGATLAPAGPRIRLGSAQSVVNLAGDPNQQVIFATVFDRGHPTRLYFLHRRSLTVTRPPVNLAAPLGAIPYATDAGAVWVSLSGVGSDAVASSPETTGSQAELHPATGPISATAFAGSPLMANFAESGSRFWALDVDGTLRCASLRDGTVEGASAAPAAGIIAADKRDVYLAPTAHVLDVLTPAPACGG